MNNGGHCVCVCQKKIRGRCRRGSTISPSTSITSGVLLLYQAAKTSFPISNFRLGYIDALVARSTSYFVLISIRKMCTKTWTKTTCHRRCLMDVRFRERITKEPDWWFTFLFQIIRNGFAVGVGARINRFSSPAVRWLGSGPFRTHARAHKHEKWSLGREESKDRNPRMKRAAIVSEWEKRVAEKQTGIVTRRQTQAQRAFSTHTHARLARAGTLFFNSFFGARPRTQTQ